MKNFNRENGIRWIGLIAFCVVMISAGFVTGCGSDDGGRSGKTRNGRAGGGRTSPSDSNKGYTNLLATGRNMTSVFSQGLSYNVDFAIEIFTANDQDATQTYYGPVNAYGYLDYDGDDILECGFTRGFWDLETVSPNGVFGTDLTGVVVNWQGTEIEARNRDDGRIARIFVATSSNSAFQGIEFEDGSPTVGLDGFTYDDVISGEIIVESVEGIPCFFRDFYGGGDYLRFTFSRGSGFL